MTPFSSSEAAILLVCAMQGPLAGPTEFLSIRRKRLRDEPKERLRRRLQSTRFAFFNQSDLSDLTMSLWIAIVRSRSLAQTRMIAASGEENAGSAIHRLKVLKSLNLIGWESNKRTMRMRQKSGLATVFLVLTKRKTGSVEEMRPILVYKARVFGETLSILFSF